MSRKALVPFVLPADPVGALEATTKQYADGLVVVSATDPIGTTPQAEIWVDTTTVAPNFSAGQITFTPVGTIAATDVQTAIAEVAAEAVQANVPWIAPTLLNSWVNFDTSLYSAAGYRKVGDLVELRGLVKSGTIGLAVFNLPVGYRPTRSHHLPVAANDAYGTCRVNGSSGGAPGDVVASAGSVSWFSLDNIRFSTL